MAESESTTLETLYLVNGSPNEVKLSIDVGDPGQSSDMTVRLSGNVIVEDHPGELPQRVIGTNKNLEGKILTIVATITDMPQTSNVTRLQINLSGGPVPSNFKLRRKVDKEGQSVDYLCLIEFFNPQMEF